MINWLRKKLGIIDVEKGVVCLHKDINEAFNRLDRIESPQQSARRKKTREGKSQRHDEIERDRKHRKKDHLRGKGK